MLDIVDASCLPVTRSEVISSLLDCISCTVQTRLPTMRTTSFLCSHWRNLEPPATRCRFTFVACDEHVLFDVCTGKTCWRKKVSVNLHCSLTACYAQCVSVLQGLAVLTSNPVLSNAIAGLATSAVGHATVEVHTCANVAQEVAVSCEHCTMNTVSFC